MHVLGCGPDLRGVRRRIWCGVRMRLGEDVGGVRDVGVVMRIAWRRVRREWFVVRSCWITCC